MAWKRTVEHTVLGGVGPLVKHLAGSTAGTVARRRGSNGYEDAMASMVGDITRGTAVNQSFIDFQMHVIGIQGLPDRGCKQRSTSSRWTHDGEATSS
jgi:hypothetical protein